MNINELMKKYANKIDQLSCDTVDCKPVDIDWRQALGPDCEGWQAVLPSSCFYHLDRDNYYNERIETENAWRCDDCGARFAEPIEFCVDADAEEGELFHDVTRTICNNCESENINMYDVPQDHELEPMMSYYYPITLKHDQKPQEVAAIVEETGPLILIEFEDGNHGLALTGGGMDLSWEICKVFIAIGFLPPVHFCDLPAMAGIDFNSKSTQLTLAACARSCQVKNNWLHSTMRSLDSLLDNS